MNPDTTWSPYGSTRRRPASLFPTADGSLPAAMTASAMVAMGFGLAVVLIVVGEGLAMPIAAWLGLPGTAASPPIALAAIGGLVLGTVLAAQVLHRQHARPLARADGAARYGYTSLGWRGMASGLLATYLTGAALVFTVLYMTGEWAQLAKLLAY